MYWAMTNRFSRAGCKLADRHYSRQKVGSNQFVAPGKPIVLIGRNNDALWVSLEQLHQDHEWKGFWLCTHFRNESAELSSELIKQAEAVTISEWGRTSKGMITFIDTEKVRKKRDFGRCFRKAGWKVFGYTKVNKLLVLGIYIEDMAQPEKAFSEQGGLFEKEIFSFQKSSA